MADFTRLENICDSGNVSPIYGKDTFLANIFRSLLKHIHRVHKKRVMVFVDEYDAPMKAEMKDEEDRASRLAFFKQIYSSVLKDNKAVEKACLAGMHHIGYANILSGFNNARFYTIQDSSAFGNCFGLTEAEVKSFLKRAFLESDEVVNDLWSKVGGIRDWYYGYCIGEDSLVNPWRSFMNCVKENFRFGSYWDKTSTSEDLINSFEGRKFDSKKFLRIILQLMKRNEDGSFSRMNVAQFNPEVNMASMKKWSTDKILQFLAMTGYLTYHSGQVWIPNKEIWTEWARVLANMGGCATYLDMQRRFHELVSAFKSFNTERISVIMTKTIKGSARGSGGKEDIYQHYIGGMPSLLNVDHCLCSCGMSAGDGIADQTICFPKDFRSVIIQYKHTEDISDDLVELAHEGLKQILYQKNYMKKILASHHVLLIGCAIGDYTPRAVSFEFRTVAASERLEQEAAPRTKRSKKHSD